MSAIPLIGVIVIILATVLLGIVATRTARTASDFFVAGRSVSVFWNASAISGEYLSAASFMGIAGLVMKGGYDALWYPVGYAAGYLLLLLFIAGPLRRFGAYTIPDFAEGRFDSAGFRKLAVLFVLFIGFFYTMPQMKGAGLTMSTILGWPYWAGIAVVGSVITFNVALGGMKGITIVQAFQYWVKVFAISLPVFVLMAVFGGYAPQQPGPHGIQDYTPELKDGTSIQLKGKDAYPANVLTMGPSLTSIEFPKGARIDKLSLSRKPKPGETPIPLREVVNYPWWKTWQDDHGIHAVSAPYPDIPQLQRALATGGPLEVPPGAVLFFIPAEVHREGAPVRDGARPVYVNAKVEFASPTEAIVRSPQAIARRIEGRPPTTSLDEQGTPAPNAPPRSQWLSPFGPITSKHGHPLLYTYSLIVALICGTAGLPHILVRFYTNPDGRAARRTTLWVMVMLGAFYVFTPVWGALGRSVMPELYANNTTDSVVIKLPTALQNETLGQILTAVTSAGAFAAFMSTFSGLLVSMSGAFAHDVYGKILRPGASPEARLRAFKIAAIAVGAASMGLGLLVETFDIATMVGWAFAIGAASYFPLLLLGAWWRGLTRTGAATGMLLGGLLSLAAIVTSMLLDKGVLKLEVGPIARTLMEQPAIWGVPLALLTMYFVSRATRSQVPPDASLKMLRLHAPEEMGVSKNYIEG